MIKTIRVMMIPNNKQKTKLFRYANTARFAYNWALAREIKSYENGGKFLSDGDLRKKFTQLKKTEEYSWLNEVSNNVTKQSIKDACNAYKRCQIGCQYARCDKYGRLTIKWYDTEITDANRATIKSTNGFTPNLDDVVITGVQVTEYLESTSTDEEASSYLYGEEGYVLKISENKLIPQGTGEVVTNIIGEKCVGMSFRPFETECLTDIVLEAGDAVLITDRKGNKYKSYLTNVVLQPGSFEQISCNAESAARNSSKTYSLVTQAAVDARKSVWRERTTREQALQEFKDRLDNSTGVYTTVQIQQDTGT